MKKTIWIVTNKIDFKTIYKLEMMGYTVKILLK